MSSVLEKHRETWARKPLLRQIYGEWYEMIVSRLSKAPGITLELGAGTGNFKEYYPQAVTADIEECEWNDMTFDAHSMPLEDSSAANIVLIDVLHHLYNPVRFLHESARTLTKGGRVIMLEPYPSPFSLQIYRRFHPEPFIFDKDYYSLSDVKDKDPWDSNQAIPYLLFFRDEDRFGKEFGSEFRIVEKENLSFLLYPASGGFENRQMIPDAAVPFFRAIEKLLWPMRKLIAFRCFVVLERL